MCRKVVNYLYRVSKALKNYAEQTSPGCAPAVTLSTSSTYVTVSPCTQGSPFAFFNALNWSIVSLLLLEILFKHSTVLLESQHSLEKYRKSTMAQDTLSSADTEGTE